MIRIAAALLCTAVMFSGCAAGKKNISKSGEVAVEVRDSDAIHIEEVSVYRLDGVLDVSGLVRRHAWSVPSRGLIEMKVVDAGGKVLTVADAEYSVTKKEVFMPRRSTPSRTGPEEGRFSIRMKFAPPPGSTVILTIKEPPEKDGS